MEKGMSPGLKLPNLVKGENFETTIDSNGNIVISTDLPSGTNVKGRIFYFEQK